ncbi:MAG: tyrosine-type recombinase/integrase [Tepidisphaeraceae bacterium]
MQAALLNMNTARGFEQDGHRLSVTTRNEYLNSLKGFTRWAFNRRKIDHDPLACLSQADERNAERMHPRRALTVEEVSALLDAAIRRPVVDLKTVRTGQHKGRLNAKVREGMLAKARQTGVDRLMAYLLIIWTGLRRGEAAKLQWRDVRLEAEHPYIQLRPEMNKAKREDRIPLHPQLVEALKAYQPAKFAPASAVLSTVPSMDVLRRDLAFAGIDYGNREIGFADLHAQRKTLNMMLATQGVESRIRQAHLRHTDVRLTEDVYFDNSLFVEPHAEKLNRTAAIPLKRGGQPEAIHADSLAQLMHNGGGVLGLFESQSGTADEGQADESKVTVDAQNTRNSPDFVTKRHNPASCDTGSEGKRVKGVEPESDLMISWDFSGIWRF